MSAPEVIAAGRPLRADARRNLEHILEAARIVFAEQGLDACVAEIAERAGVGTATIFRRFPTKDDLLVAVLVHRLHELVDIGRRALASGEPGAAFRRFLRDLALRFISDRALFEAVEDGRLGGAETGEIVEELRASVAELLRRAQTCGAIRPDVTTEDIRVIVHAVAQAGLLLEPVAPSAWPRYLDIVLDGLAANGSLSRRAPTPKQMAALTVGTCRDEHGRRSRSTPSRDRTGHTPP
jgi:AcrR family transcriptional regulator